MNGYQKLRNEIASLKKERIEFITKLYELSKEEDKSKLLYLITETYVFSKPFSMNDVKLFKAIPKETAYNTVEEYMQIETYDKKD